jgi:hypothetical protein
MQQTFLLRRRAVLAALPLAAMPAIALPALAQQPAGSDISFSYRYALPVFEMARLRYRQLFDAANPHRVAPNTLVHARKLADHTSRMVTTPNNDTLYSTASVDLTQGPVRIDVPDFGGRYYCIALMDMFTNNFAYIGRRTTGTMPGSFLLAGPDWHGPVPPGARLIQAPTPYVCLLMRILVQGTADLPAVHALQDSVHLAAVGDRTPPVVPIAPVQDDPIAFAAVVNQALAANRPPPADRPALTRLAATGIVPGGQLSATEAAAWKAHFAEAEAALRRNAGSWAHNIVDGWSYSATDTGNFGTDYDTRAAVALGGLLALTRDEAMYSNATADSAGRPLDPTATYTFHLPHDVPVDAFWSLSMYQLFPDGRLYFADNALHRYAIGDRTPGLRRNMDGSLDILLQRSAPAESQRSNWLPIPADGPFRVTMRAYQPRRALLDGKFHFAPLQRAA